jgi:hypothetical protein
LNRPIDSAAAVFDDLLCSARSTYYIIVNSNYNNNEHDRDQDGSQAKPSSLWRQSRDIGVSRISVRLNVASHTCRSIIDDRSKQ